MITDAFSNRDVRRMSDDVAGVEAVRSAGQLVLVLRGEFDEWTSAKLRDVARDLRDHPTIPVLIDGSAVSFVSSAFVAALLLLSQAVDENVTIVRASPPMTRILRITGLESWLPAPAAAEPEPLPMASLPLPRPRNAHPDHH